MSNFKCYWPVITVIDQTGKEIVINGQAIASLDSRSLIRYSVCCEKQPKNFDEKRCESVKAFLQQRCEAIDEIDPTTSKLLQILLAYCSDSTLDAFGGRQLLELKDIKERFLRFTNKITIKNIQFREATENSKNHCRCSPGEPSILEDEFMDLWNDQMCSDPPQEPPINEDPEEEPIYGEPKPPPPKPETQPPSGSLVIGSIDFSNDCLENNKTKIISAITPNLLSFLKPGIDIDGKKLERSLIDNLSEISMSDLAKLVNIIKVSPISKRTIDSQEIVLNTIINECTVALLDIYNIPKNSGIASNESINKSANNQYSKYADVISCTAQSNMPLLYGFIPKTFTLNFYNQQKFQKDLEKTGVYLYKALPPNNSNKYYTLKPLDVIRVPVELYFNYTVTLNLEKLTVPFIINADGENKKTFEPCEEIEGTKEITLTRESKEINSNFYTIEFQATTTVYVDYKLVMSETRPDQNSTSIKTYPQDKKLKNYTTILGDENPTYHIKFLPNTKNDTIKILADAIIDPSTSKPIDYTIFNDADGVYLICNTNGEILQSIIETSNISIPSTSIVCEDEEIASRNNVDKWINIKCQPSINYVEKVKYVLVDRTNGGAYGNDSDSEISSEIILDDPQNPTIVKITDQIRKNIFNVNKINVSIFDQGKFNHDIILTQTGIDKIKTVLETKVEKTECCCYNWVIGFISNLQKYFYIPLKMNGKSYAVFTKKFDFPNKKK